MEEGGGGGGVGGGGVGGCEKCTIQQLVPSHVHIRRPLGKRFDKKYVVATMKPPPRQMTWGTVLCCCAARLYFIPPKTTMNGPKFVEFVQRETETAQASPQLHDVHV